MKRNHDKHTNLETARLNILKALAILDDRDAANKSYLGYRAYPDYNFRWPQGAAFSVAKIVSEMKKEKLITYRAYRTELYDGWVITQKGRDYLKAVVEAMKGQA